MSNILDLHDIATLVNYERATTEPRFRHAKLRELSTDPHGRLAFSTVKIESLELPRLPVRGFVFDTAVSGNHDDRDLPINMLPISSTRQRSVAQLSDEDLENIYWEVRGHDGCFKTIGILQHFFNLFPDSQGLRIRTADGLDFLTTISKREIVEYDLNSPSQVTLSLIYSERMTYVTGGEKSMLHAVWRFSKLGNSTANSSAMLDLASMQFGVNGKGKGGESFFLGSKNRFDLFLGTVCEDVVFKKSSLWIGESPDDPWFQDVARRVKQRWDERDTKPWCGQCGAPLTEPKRCPCKGAYYCGSVHQKAAWKFHKHHCSTRRN